jgi:hypothetical protein
LLRPALLQQLTSASKSPFYKSDSDYKRIYDQVMDLYTATTERFMDECSPVGEAYLEAITESRWLYLCKILTSLQKEASQNPDLVDAGEMCSYNKDGVQYEGINFVDGPHVSTYWKPAIVLTQNILAFMVIIISGLIGRRKFDDFMTFPSTWFHPLGRVMLVCFRSCSCQDVGRAKCHLLKEHFCINYLR